MKTHDASADSMIGAEGHASWLKRALGYLFALACLAWVFHDLHPHRLLASMRIGNWWFVAASIFFDVLTYVVQGSRWTLLLRPVGHLRRAKATQAVYVGLFTNEVVPLRFGEVVRAFLVSRWLNVNVGSIVPSMVVERFLDALWLACGFGLAAIYVQLPGNLLKAGDVLGVTVLVASLVFGWIVIRRERQLGNEEPPTRNRNVHQGSRLASALSAIITSLAVGLKQIGISRDLFISSVFSGLMLGCQALAVWFILLACGVNLPVAAAGVVVVVVRLGTAIPNAPANVGSFQFFTVIALSLFGVEKSVAAGVSIVDFAVLTGPLWMIGLFSLARTGMSLHDIRADIGALRTKVITA